MTRSSASSFCGATTVFVVRDVPRSVEHYRGEPTFYAGVERDGVAIQLQVAGETTRQPGRGALKVFVTDVGALYGEWKSRGARTLDEPRDYPYGMRNFHIHDLDGDQLCFGTESKAR